MKKLLPLVLVVSALAVVGCSKKGSSTPAVFDEGLGLPVTAETRTALDGVWKVTTVTDPADASVELAGNGYFIINGVNFTDMINENDTTCETAGNFPMTLNIIDGPVISGATRVDGGAAVNVVSTLSADDTALKLEFFSATGASVWTVDAVVAYAYQSGDVATLTAEVKDQLGCVEPIEGVYEHTGYGSWDTPYTNNSSFSGRVFVFDNAETTSIEGYFKEAGKTTCEWRQAITVKATGITTVTYTDGTQEDYVVFHQGGSETGTLDSFYYDTFDTNLTDLRDRFTATYIGAPAESGPFRQRDYREANCPNL